MTDADGVKHDAIEKARKTVHDVIWPVLRDCPDDNSWVWSEVALCITEPVIEALSAAGLLTWRDDT